MAPAAPKALTGLHRSRSVFASISQTWWPSGRKEQETSVTLCGREPPPRSPHVIQTQGPEPGETPGDPRRPIPGLLLRAAPQDPCAQAGPQAQRQSSPGSLGKLRIRGSGLVLTPVLGGKDYRAGASSGICPGPASAGLSQPQDRSREGFYAPVLSRESRCEGQQVAHHQSVCRASVRGPGAWLCSPWPSLPGMHEV